MKEGYGGIFMDGMIVCMNRCKYCISDVGMNRDIAVQFWIK